MYLYKWSWLIVAGQSIKLLSRLIEISGKTSIFLTVSGQYTGYALLGMNTINRHWSKAKNCLWYNDRYSNDNNKT